MAQDGHSSSGAEVAPSSAADVRAYYRKVGPDGSLRDPHMLPVEYTRGLGDIAPALPECPIIVMINPESGGRAGPECMAAMRQALGYSQVFDLTKHRPDQVLQTLWKNFEAHESAHPERVKALRERLRILVAGGDGTVGWTMQEIKRNEIKPNPAVGIMPLGTGNDLSRILNWGTAFDKSCIKDHDALHRTLRSLADAEAVSMDRWELQLKAPEATYFQRARPPSFKALNGDSKGSVSWLGCFVVQRAAIKHPTALSLHVTDQWEVQSATHHTAFSWNYFSIGMDAKTVYGFDQLREKKPKLTPGGNINKFWYGFFCCSSGWFCGEGDELSAQVDLELQDNKGKWAKHEVPENVSAIVFVNNQSYAGGNDLWQHDKKGDEQGWKRPSYSDGLVEVVGFTSGYHAGAVLFKAMPCVRMAQAAGVRVRIAGLHPKSAKGPDGELASVFMQLDGEPWLQDVPSGEGQHLEATFTKSGQSTVLVAPSPK